MRVSPHACSAAAALPPEGAAPALGRPCGGRVPTPHWAEAYLFADLRWTENGAGPREYHCWNFVREIQRRHFGREVPLLPIGDEAATRAALVAWGYRADWTKRVGAPREGDIVLMRGMDLHVGVWIEADGGGVLHCQRERDVTFDDARSLALCGYRIERVWAWRGN